MSSVFTQDIARRAISFMQTVWVSYTTPRSFVQPSSTLFVISHHTVSILIVMDASFLLDFSHHAIVIHSALLITSVCHTGPFHSHSCIHTKCYYLVTRHHAILSLVAFLAWSSHAWTAACFYVSYRRALLVNDMISHHSMLMDASLLLAFSHHAIFLHAAFLCVISLPHTMPFSFTNPF